MHPYFPLLLLGVSLPAAAIDFQGLVDLRAVAASSAHSWTDAGLGKLRYGKSNDGIRIGQAMLRADIELADTLSASGILSADDARSGVLDVTEAWVRWNPVPTGPWKASVRAGAFFPALSLENDGLGWTPHDTISTSAVNSWIGEEFRTIGVEAGFARRGKPLGSLHDFSVSVAAFRANDPNGSVLTWRGWAISDRITGLREPLLLADLPGYAPGGPVFAQTRRIHLFRELDGRIGYHADARYGYAGWLEASVMHYDNRANPRVIEDDQWGWRTKFDHAAVKLHLGRWQLKAQAMQGSTLMGRSLAAVDFRAWYLLAAHPAGPGLLTLRLDHFRTRDTDRFPDLDPNGEEGKALALAYKHPLAPGWTLVAEALAVHSNRPARLLLGQQPRQREHSLTGALRWQF